MGCCSAGCARGAGEPYDSIQSYYTTRDTTKQSLRCVPDKGLSACERQTRPSEGSARPSRPHTTPLALSTPPLFAHLPSSTLISLVRHTPTLLLSLAKRWMNLDAGYDSSDEVDRQLLLPSAHASSSFARPSTTTPMPGPPPLAKTSARAASSYRAYLPHRPSLGFRRGFRTTSTVKDKDQGGLGGAGAQGEGKRKRRAFGCESPPSSFTPPLRVIYRSSQEAGGRVGDVCRLGQSLNLGGRNGGKSYLPSRGGSRSSSLPSLCPRSSHVQPPLPSPLYLRHSC